MRCSQERLVGDVATEDSWGSASQDPLTDSVEPLMGEETGVYFPNLILHWLGVTPGLYTPGFVPAQVEVEYSLGAREHPKVERCRKL